MPNLNAEVKKSCSAPARARARPRESRISRGVMEQSDCRRIGLSFRRRSPSHGSSTSTIYVLRLSRSRITRHAGSGNRPISKPPDPCFIGVLRIRDMDLNLDDETREEMTGNEEFKALNAPPPQGGQPYNRRFNRNSAWLATGILSSLISAALMFAVQERHAKVTDQAKEDKETGGAALVNANPGVHSNVATLRAESSTGEIRLRQAINVTPGSAVISPLQNPFVWMEIPERPSQASLPMLTPKNDQPVAQANASRQPSVRGQDSARVIRAKIHNIRPRSSERRKVVHAKMRLLALWHQSLAQKSAHGSLVTTQALSAR